jgi:hypothetical protein
VILRFGKRRAIVWFGHAVASCCRCHHGSEIRCYNGRGHLDCGLLFKAVGLLVGAHALGQTPVEHHDFAEVSQNDVLSFEIAVDDAP